MRPESSRTATVIGGLDPEPIAATVAGAPLRPGTAPGADALNTRPCVAAASVGAATTGARSPDWTVAGVSGEAGTRTIMVGCAGDPGVALSVTAFGPPAPIGEPAVAGAVGVGQQRLHR